MGFGATPEENVVYLDPRPPKAPKKKGWDITAEDDNGSGRH